MERMERGFGRTLAALLTLGLTAARTDDPPIEWVDPATGHRVVRLSEQAGSQSLYFHQNAFAPEGDKMVFTAPGGLFTVELKNRKVDRLTDRRANGVVVGRKGRHAYYRVGDTVYATNLDTRETRVVAKTPDEYSRGSGLSVNADDTLLAGSSIEPGSAPAEAPLRRRSLDETFELHLPRLIYTIDVRTGEVKVIHRGKDWFNHVQFSPTDPGLILFCHEGPWHKVDRIWTVRADGSGLQKIHERTMEMEIVGHEFWNPDGKIVWYDQQTPKGKEFWLAGTVPATGDKARSKIERNHWSVHYNVSADGKLFAGDGGGPQMVARAADGQWIYLFRPKDGTVEVERLVNLAKHDYKLEPNVMFTPDAKWVVFRSNMHGPSHVYGVEVAK